MAAAEGGAGGPKVASETGGEASGPECISVVARLRPSEESSESIKLTKNQVEVSVPRNAGEINNHIEEYHFKFANVFGPEASQAEVFNGAARDLVLGAIDGVNCTIFAYGQTGSGKTHTICGYHRQRGIIPRTLACIFEEIERRATIDYTISMSFIEVYKEVGYDLLAYDFGKNLQSAVVSVSLMSGEPVLQGAKKEKIASEEDGLHHYFLGDTHRTVAETAHNQNSSRSHCIFTVFIEASDPVNQTVRTSKVQIVDLAGSERLKPYEAGSQEDKALMGQAIAINLSLHTLERVILSLNKGDMVVPYRESFLTKVLKDALGGNARAVMFCTINPKDEALPETLSSCRFAMRVANVKTYSKVNEEKDPQLVIAALKQENAELRAALAAAEGGSAAEAASPDELRRRARTFLEDESKAGDGAEDSGTGSVMSVGSLVEAFAAFRILRELFWELLRSRGAAPREESGAGGGGGYPTTPAKGGSRAATPRAAAPSATEGGANAAVGAGAEGRGAGAEAGAELAAAVAVAAAAPAAGQSAAGLRAALEERDGECRMLKAELRAAVQAQQQAERQARAAARPVRRSAPSISASTQTEGGPTPKRQRPKRPSSADPRPKGMRKDIGFRSEDVVDRFGYNDGTAKPCVLPSLARSTADLRIPDFRTLKRDDEDEDEEEEEDEPREAEREGGLPPIPAARGGVCRRPATARSSASSQGSPARSRSSPTHAAGIPSSASRAPAPTAASKQPSSPSAAAAAPRAEKPPAASPGPAAKPPGGASAAWLSATTALTREELEVFADPAQAYKLFLEHDPRAADIWPSDLQDVRRERRERMEEAQRLGEEIERAKEATRKVQASLQSLKEKLRQAEAEAAVDPSAAQRAATLREVLAGEEPKLVQLFDEKRQRYELDVARLKEVRRELLTLEHGEKKIEAMVQAEFAQWRRAVAERYPQAAAAGTPKATAPAAVSPAAVSPAAPRGAPPQPPTPSAGASGAGGATPSASQRQPQAATPTRGVGAASASTPAAASMAPTPPPPPPAAPPVPSAALANAEAALQNLRRRLEEARQSGDTRREQMLEQLLASEEPRLARLRAGQG